MKDSLQEVVVTGSHIKGVESNASPVFVFDRESIKEGGFATLEALLDTLPQNFNDVSPDGFWSTESGSTVASANTDRASGIDLRGLGADSTLTLLNGSRRAGAVAGRVVDISAIPLSVIERVEVVAGGRSAIYGSDAVGGVVNLVTRRDFSGAESQLDVGDSGDGGGRLRASQMFGHSTADGGFVMAVDYQHDDGLDLADAGLLSPQAPFGKYTSLLILPKGSRKSFFGSGYWSPTGDVQLYGDVLYSRKAGDNTIRLLASALGATNESYQTDTTQNDQYSVSAGANVRLAEDWSVDLRAVRSAVDAEVFKSGVIDYGSIGVFPLDNYSNDKVGMTSGTLVANGPTGVVLGGGAVRAAVGVEGRRDTLHRVANDTQPERRAREVFSVFGELYLPVFGGDAHTGRHLDISIAGRYDHYDDVGDTANPQVGIVYQPLRALTLRAAYSKAFRAPDLARTGDAASGYVFLATDPNTKEDMPVLMETGDNPSLKPEKADTWSVGFDLAPPPAPWLTFSTDYFEVRYKGRLAIPATGNDQFDILAKEAQFPSLVNRTPDAATLDAVVAAIQADDIVGNITDTPWDPATQPILSAFPNVVLFDNRINNLAVETVSGLDVSLGTKFDTRLGAITAGVRATKTLDAKRRLTANSPAITKINEVGKPVDFRLRGNIGWAQGALGAYLYVNYTDSYADPFSTPPGTMGSFTTADLTLLFDGTRSYHSGFLAGFTVALSASNLFDKRPPLFRNGSNNGLLYDSVNASAIGRYVSMQLTKHWGAAR